MAEWMFLGNEQCICTMEHLLRTSLIASFLLSWGQRPRASDRRERRNFPLSRGKDIATSLSSLCRGRSQPCPYNERFLYPGGGYRQSLPNDLLSDYRSAPRRFQQHLRS